MDETPRSVSRPTPADNRTSAKMASGFPALRRAVLSSIAGGLPVWTRPAISPQLAIYLAVARFARIAALQGRCTLVAETIPICRHLALIYNWSFRSGAICRKQFGMLFWLWLSHRKGFHTTPLMTLEVASQEWPAGGRTRRAGPRTTGANGSPNQ